MKNWKVLVLLLAVPALAAGCTKKSNEQASITGGTGFDTIASTEDLAQLPQVSTAAQQAGVEVLPIETAPVTQGVPPVSPITPAVTIPTDVSGLTQDQKVQTALRNAGLYQGNIDGKIGPASKRAIQEFQQAHNLTVDGKVGPRTWAALEPYLFGAPQTASTTSVDQ